MKIRKIASERKWPVEVKVVEFRELRQAAAGADVIVQIAPHDNEDYGIPRLSGVPFLTGFGLDKVIEELEAIVKASETPLEEPAQNGL
jgi:PTS system galactitol-specific IIB component